MVAVRLSAIHPDGSAKRCCYGVLNLNHSDNHAVTTPLIPGKRYRVSVDLNHIGLTVFAGHCLRLGISSSYWPLVWPPAQSTRLSIVTGDSHLHLPVRRRVPADHQVKFEEPTPLPALAVQQLWPPQQSWIVRRDLFHNESTLEEIKNQGSFYIEEIDLTITDDTREWYSFKNADFHSPSAEVLAIRKLERKDWSIYTRTRTVLTADPENFYLLAELDAYENDGRVYSQNWNRKIPRDGI